MTEHHGSISVMSNDEICMANRCLHWSIYWDEETDEYYECCSAAYDTPKESIPENCPCIDEFKGEQG